MASAHVLTTSVSSASSTNVKHSLAVASTRNGPVEKVCCMVEKQNLPLLRKDWKRDTNQMKRGSWGGTSIKEVRRSTSVARAGLPVVGGIPVLGPVVNVLLNPVLLTFLYLAGGTKFWSGFPRTTYTNNMGTKVRLTALWPVLFLVSKAFRTNFKKAVQ